MTALLRENRKSDVECNSNFPISENEVYNYSASSADGLSDLGPLLNSIQSVCTLSSIVIVLPACPLFLEL